MRTHQAIVLSFIVLSGCTATQLRYQTLNQAGTVESITEKQIFFNLEQFDKNPYAFPSQVTVIAGSASTTNSVSPTFMTPLGMATTVTSQFANAAQASVANALVATTSNTVATAVTTGTSSLTTNGTTGTTTNTTGGMTTDTTSTAPAGPGSMHAVQTSISNAVANGTSNSVATGTTGGTSTTNTAVANGGNTTTNTTGNTGTTTDTSAATRANRSLSLAMSDNWMESWTLDPVVNPDVLRRLTALYRYVLGETRAAKRKADDTDRNLKRPEFRAWAIAHKNEIDDQFMCEYVLPAATGSSADAQQTTITTTKSEGPLGGTTTTTTQSGPEKPAGGGEDKSVTLVFRCLVDNDGKYRKRSVSVKRSTLALPGCVICLDGNPPEDPNATVIPAFKYTGGSEPESDYLPYINPNLRFGLITHAKPAEKDKSEAHIGRNFYGDVEVDPNVHLTFHEFELLVNSATIVDASTSATTGGAKGSNPKVLAVPVSPNGFLLK